MQQSPAVCIDAVPLLVPSAGIKNYLYYWIRALQGADGGPMRLFPLLSTSKLVLRHDASCAGTFQTQRALALYYLAQLARIDSLKPHCDVFHATKLMSPPRRAA